MLQIVTSYAKENSIIHVTPINFIVPKYYIERNNNSFTIHFDSKPNQNKEIKMSWMIINKY